MQHSNARPHRLLFCTLSGFGHVFPMFPLAVAARDAGHEVAFATGADAAPVVDRAGFVAHRAGISIPDGFSELAGGRPVTDLPEATRREMAHEVFAKVLPRHTIRDLTPLRAELAPDLIIYNEWDPGAAVVAMAAGVPAVEYRISRTYLPDGDARRALPLGADDRAELFAAHGLPGVPANRFLDLLPPSLQDPAVLDDPRRLPMRPVAWADPGAAVPDRVRADRSRPLVYLTLGTTPNDVRVLQTALAGLAKHDVNVLVALGQLSAESLRADDRVRLVRWVDQAEVLRHADLVIHHGGSGTTLGTAAAGLPQLVLPQRADQFSQAVAVTAAGVGRALLPVEVTPDAVAEAVDALLGSAEHRRAAAATRAEIDAMPTPAEVLPQVLQVADGRSPQVADHGESGAGAA